MNGDEKDTWEQFLNPEVLRTKLIIISLYITAFEILKDCIINRIKSLFNLGYDKHGTILDKNKYNEEVLSLDKNSLIASLQWLKSKKIIDTEDIEKFDKIRSCRNEIAHEIKDLVFQEWKTDPIPLFNEIIYLVHKIEKWWILEYEIPINQDFDGQEIDESGISPGRTLMLRLLTDIALGSKEKS